MRKYISIIKLYCKQHLNYKIHLIFSFISAGIPLIASYYLWETIYKVGYGSLPTLHYSFSEMLTYVFGAYILNQFITPFGIEWEISSDIFEGKLSRYLLYPVEYTWLCFSKLSAEKFIMCFLRLPVVLIFSFLFRKDLSYSIDFSIIYFILSMLLAYILYSLLSFSIGFLAFWFTDVTGFFYIGNTIIILCSGVLIPLDLFPDTIFSILQYLPFYYIVYFPLKIFVQNLNTTDILHGYVVQVIWIYVLYLFVKKWFNIGVKKYESFGG